jgi:hypothetical protein
VCNASKQHKDLQASTVSPLVDATARNKEAVVEAIDRINVGYSTNLSGGLYEVCSMCLVNELHV